MPNINIIGTDPDQVPTNGDLGTMAFQDQEYVSVGNLVATTVDITTEARINRFSTANARITGGSITGINGESDRWVVTSGFSTGNAFISGGAIGVTTAGVVSAIANIYVNTASIGNLSTANAFIFGAGGIGYTQANAVSRIGNVFSTYGNFTNFSTGNAVIVAGNITGAGTSIGLDSASAVNRVANVFATTANFTNLSAANAIITGTSSNVGVDNAGTVSRIANVYATFGQFTNLSSGNARLTGGSITGGTGAFTTLQVNDLSSGNVFLAGAGGIGYTATNTVARIGNVFSTYGNFVNFSTGNAVIVAGNITGSGTSIGVDSAGAVNRIATLFGSAGNYTNFSTGNAVVTGTSSNIGVDNSGTVSRIANVYADYGNFNNLSSANARLTGGSITGGTGAFTRLQVNDLSSGNVFLTGAGGIGYSVTNTVSRIGNVYADYGNFTNFSTGNAVITTAVITGTTSNIGVDNSGTVSRIANVYSTFENVTNLSAANANFVSGNITSGNITGTGTSIGQDALLAVNRISNVFSTFGNFTNLTSANVIITDSADLTKRFTPNLTQTPASRISNYAMPTVSFTGNGSSLVGTYWRYAANVSYAAQTSTVLFDLLGPINGTGINIEGGALGTQGALRCRLYGNILNTVTATNTSNVMVCFGTANLVLGLTEQLTANTAPRPFMLDFTINNLNSTSVQTVYGTYFVGAPGSFNSVGQTTQGALTRTYPFGFTAAQNTAGNLALRVMAAQNGTTAGMTTTVNYASIQLLHH